MVLWIPAELCVVNVVLAVLIELVVLVVLEELTVV